MASRTFNGTTNTTFSTASNWDGGVSVPSSGDTIIIASNCVLSGNDSNIYGALTINSSINFNIQTFNFNCGLVTINGTLQMGNSATNGLTCSGLVANTGSHINLAVSSIINNSSNLSLSNSYLFTVNYRGIYKQTGSGNYNNQSLGNTFNSFIQSSGVTTTLISNSYIGNDSCSNVTINGIISGAYTLSIGVSSTGTFTVGTNGDFQCNSLSLMVVNGATLVNNRTTPFTVTDVSCQSLDEMVIPGWDFTNASVYVNGPFNSGSRYISAGTLHCINLTFYADVMANFIMYNSASLVISGNVDFKASIDNVSYTKGGGTITLIGTTGTQTINFNGQSVEPITINSSGSIKQLVAGKNVSTPSLTVTAGTIDLNTCDCNVSGSVSVSSGSTFKMGVSSSNGLTCNGLTYLTYSNVDLQNGSKINNSGNYTTASTVFFVNGGGKGTYTQTGNGNLSGGNISNERFYSFVINSGYTATITSAIQLSSCDVTQSVTINGTINVNNNTINLGVVPGGTMSVGVNGDISGLGVIVFLIIDGATVTNNRITPFSYNGSFRVTLGNYPNLYVPSWDFSNASFIVVPSSSNTNTIYLGNGTLKCNSITNSLNSSPTTITVDCSKYNPSIVCSGAVSFTPTSGTINWVKGTGSFSLTSQSITTIDFNGKSIGNVIMNNNNTTPTITFTKSFSCGNFTFLSQGRIIVNTNVTITGTGTLTSLSSNTIICNNTNGMIGSSNSAFNGFTYSFANNTVFDYRVTLSISSSNTPSGTYGLQINSAAITVTLSSNLTCNVLTTFSGTFSIGTYDLNCGNCTVYSGGTLQMGTSTNSGLTCNSFTANLGSTVDLQQGSKINNNGNFILPNSTVFLTNARGTYTQTGSGNYAATFNGNYFYSWTQNSGVTTTLTASSYLSSYYVRYLTINGIINGGYGLILGVSSTGVMTIGSNCDITTNILSFYSKNGATYTNNKSTAFTVTTVNISNSGVDDLCLPAWDFSNSNVTVLGGSLVGLNRYISNGTLSCINYTVSSVIGNNFTLNNTNNPNFNISGNIIFTTNDVVTYIKGTGTITLGGISGTKTIDFNNKSVESIVGNSSGTTKNIVNNFTINGISGVMGVLQSSVSGTQRIISLNNNSTVNSGSFKDIKIDNGTHKINGKTCTNLGNNNGIVFKDNIKLT